MHKHLACLLLVVLAGFGGGSSAANTLIDLDSAPGNFSVWKVSDVSANAVTFDATYVALQKHAKWAPTYAIELGDGTGQSITFKGSFQGSDTPETSAVLSRKGEDDASSESVLVFRLKQQYKVSLAWTDGTVSVAANGVTKRHDVGFKPTQIKISCSTGELEVKNIVFTGT